MTDYIELEYIESTGTQYIDTNYIPNNTTKFSIKSSTGGVAEHTGMFGARTYWYDGNYWSTYAFLSYWEMSDWTVPNAIRVDILGTGNSIDGATGKTWVKDIPYIIDIDMIARTLKIDNQIMKSSFGPIDNKIITTMSLFANHSDWKNSDGSEKQPSEYQWHIVGRIYYCKIWNNNILVRDFIPVKRKSDNEVCLYDKVSGEYFTNQGTGNFIAGPEIIVEPTLEENLALISTKITTLNNLCENILGIPSYEIVPFATATDAQISALLDAHYRGDIDLSEIWEVGDTRVIHIDALTAPVAGSHTAHAAQDMTFRIIGFNHDNLTTSINGITKAAVTIECREVLGNNGSPERDYLSANDTGSTYENPSFFDNAYRRTWLNNNFVDALPATFKVLVKEVIKRNLQGHNNTTNYVETNDKAFLLSYPEVFSSTNTYYRGGAALSDFEGTQYSYYNQNNTDAGRIKYVNNNGSSSSTAQYYWLRSPSSYLSNCWCNVTKNGSDSYYYCDNIYGLAPALVI